MTEDKVLKLALEALELVNIEFICSGAHHAKKDRHELGDDCPLTARYQNAITAIKEALAQPEQALDKFFEVENELGLHYDEKPTQDGNVCARCGGIVFDPVLTKPEQEPLEYWNAVEGWVKIEEVREHFDAVGCGTIYKTAGEDRVALYTAPPKREWVGLTDEECEEIMRYEKDFWGVSGWEWECMKSIAAKLKEKNT